MAAAHGDMVNRSSKQHKDRNKGNEGAVYPPPKGGKHNENKGKNLHSLWEQHGF